MERSENRGIQRGKLDDPRARPDFIISSIFTHHLTDGEVIKFLQWMDRHATQLIGSRKNLPIAFFLTEQFLSGEPPMPELEVG